MDGAVVEVQPHRPARREERARGKDARLEPRDVLVDRRPAIDVGHGAAGAHPPAFPRAPSSTPTEKGGSRYASSALFAGTCRGRSSASPRRITAPRSPPKRRRGARRSPRPGPRRSPARQAPGPSRTHAPGRSGRSRPPRRRRCSRCGRGYDRRAAAGARLGHDLLRAEDDLSRLAPRARPLEDDRLQDVADEDPLHPRLVVLEERAEEQPLALDVEANIPIVEASHARPSASKTGSPGSAIGSPSSVSR